MSWLLSSQLKAEILCRRQCQVVAHFPQHGKGKHFMFQLYTNIFIHQSHLRGNVQLSNGFCAVVERKWLMNLIDQQLQLQHAWQNLPSLIRREACSCFYTGTLHPGAVVCGEVVIDSTTKSIFIKTHISKILYKVTRGIYLKKNAISSVYPKWLPLNTTTCNVL